MSIGDDAWERVARASDFIGKLIASGETVYGINTDSSLCRTCGSAVAVGGASGKPYPLSRSGVGAETSREIVLSMWLLRLNTMCRGHSGNRPEVMRQAIRLIEAGVLGCVPSRGSVGASGDLAPSAHAVLPLLGEGCCTRPTVEKTGFERVPAHLALKDLGIEPLKLAPKEGWLSSTAPSIRLRWQSRRGCKDVDYGERQI